ncbi:MAG: hypothetical protein CVU96_05400 [Firmicutes bacterium HGW-Firmicutes-20]|nr:MAG: hypothetical protein CVU96_05400 [Firmicutes bacterium HGW-Firmicutes-20]
MYFHNGNNQPTTTFNRNECLFEDVFVSNLEEGSYLISDIPYFFSASNGHMSISSQMKSFKHIDSSHNLIETVSIIFITECPDQKNSVIEKGSRREYFDIGLFLLMFMIVLSILVIYKRRNNHVKNRFYR